MNSVTPARQKRQRRERWFVVGALASCALLTLVLFAFLYGPAFWAYWNYVPQEGDVIFQSLPRSPLVNAIEGVSDSPYSHCGIVAQRDGEWIVYEAFRDVEVTPLGEFLFRGRESGFAVYRFKPEFRHYVPATIDNAARYLGRPYDVRYQMDDEKIYCTELIFKAYQQAAGGEQLGKLVRLGDLNWRPYVQTIEHFEQGPVPLDREIITPKDMAQANQLELVSAFNIGAAGR